MFVVPSFFGFQDAGKLDPDYLAFYARVTTAGGSLTTTEQAATNQLVVDLKGYGIWNLMKAIYPMVGGGTGTTAQRQAACEQNLKSSSFTGTFTSGWSFASTGVTPNGSSAYFNTNFNTSTNFSTTSAHLSLYVRNNVAENSYDFANASNLALTSNPTYLIPRYLASNAAFLGLPDSNYGTSVASTDSKGFWLGATNGSSTQTLYKDGSSIKTGTNAGNFANNNIYLGAANAGGTATDFASKQYAFASLGDGLSATNSSDFYTAVQAFQTTLSRQV